MSGHNSSATCLALLKQVHAVLWLIYSLERRSCKLGLLREALLPHVLPHVLPQSLQKSPPSLPLAPWWPCGAGRQQLRLMRGALHGGNSSAV